ncbi:MAG: glucoamylase family protein [Gemmatimonadota bacterium]
MQAVGAGVLQYLSQQLDADALVGFVNAYQSIAPLRMVELWTLPAALQLALLETLVSGAERALEIETMTAIPDWPPRSQPSWMTLANCIGSLRLIGGMNWREFFDATSLVEKTLREDPSSIYERMDFATRDRYRQVLAEVAVDSGWSEEGVAGAVVLLSRRDTKTESRSGHVGFYLIAEGRTELELHVACRPRTRKRVSRWVRRHAFPLYTGVVVTLTLLIAAALWLLVGVPGVPLSARIMVLASGVVPGLTVAGSLLNWIVSHSVPARVLPKLRIRDEVPEDCTTLVALPVLIGDAHELDQLLEHLEVLYQSTGLRRLRFTLLTDFQDADFKHLPEEDELLERARQGVLLLNRRHQTDGEPPFLLFHRERQWNQHEGRWMGWERKRGKLIELSRLLMGVDDGGLVLMAGSRTGLEATKYVITLDRDTGLPRGSVERMIGAMAHPLNEPVLTEEDRVVAGYTVLQPRLETILDPGRPTLFAWLGRVPSGLDLYTHAISDVYQDVFAEGIYAGKGIFHVRAFEASLAGRVPDNRLLSHDLFEGAHGRCGFLGDVILLEDFPDQPLAYMRRLHRWVRGDWQLLPWLMPRVPSAAGPRIRNQLRPISRWQIWDNLRRSLLAPSLMAMLLFGWFLGLGPPWRWAVGAMVVLGFPALLGAATATRRFIHVARSDDRSEGGRKHTSHGRTGLAANLGRWVLAGVFLPYEAWIALDAILRTLARLWITRRHLLEWTPEAASRRALRAHGGLFGHWRRMIVAPLVGVGGAFWLWSVLGNLPGVSLAFFGAWTASPAVAFLLSRPIPSRRREIPAQAEWLLREIALRTWLFFDQFVTAEDHFLPPDNWQEDREPALARRTSPTNIGMLLTSLVAAYDMGYVGLLSLESRVRNVLDSVDQLESYRGHLLNWYSTEDLRPLEPRYVSSVDSGNYAAALVVLRRTLLDAARVPVIRPVDSRGVMDVAQTFSRFVESGPAAHTDAARRLHDLLIDLDGACQLAGSDALEFVSLHLELRERLLPAIDESAVSLAEHSSMNRAAIHELRDWLSQLHRQLDLWDAERSALDPWTASLAAPPSLFAGGASLRSYESARVERIWSDLRTVLLRSVSPLDVPSMASKAQEHATRLEDVVRAGAFDADSVQCIVTWCEGLRSELARSIAESKRLLDSLDELTDRCTVQIEEMDFGFLYDRSRRLLHIGYQVTAEELDPHYYDLLASEARLASYVGIAKGDLPSSHWLQLGRAFGLVGRSPVLLSWSATMFEYLLPAVFMRSPPTSLLAHSSRQAVREHMNFGRRHGIPWGASESAYGHRGDGDSYQYRAFGVPGLGLRRGLGERRVVAPYASFLALPYAPLKASRNVEGLVHLGAKGRWGMYESLDFGSQGESTSSPTVIRAYMAHHQGMILAALDNLLHDDVLIRRFHTDPRMAAVEYLLHEGLPWRVPVRPDWAAREGALPKGPSRVVALESWSPSPGGPMASLHTLSNGRYRVTLSDGGGGGSWWEDMAITRWQPDAVRECQGQWLYLLDLDSGALWSAGRAPTGSSEGDVSAEYWPHMAALNRRDHQISSHLRITIPPDADVEIRRLTITNESDKTRRLAAVSYAEIVLGSGDEDLRHPAYSKLFLEGEYRRNPGCVVYRRRPKSPEEPSAYLAQALVGDDGDGLSSTWELSREVFLGRSGSSARPEALARGKAELSGKRGAPLDPIVALSAEFRLPPYATTEFACLTAVGRNEEDVLARIEEYRSLTRCAWAFESARQMAEEELAALGLHPSEHQDFQRLLSALIQGGHGLRAPADVRSVSAAPQAELWRFGISGDLPLLVLRLGHPEELEMARTLLRAHAYWRQKGVAIDLVLEDLASSGYAQPARDALRAALAESGSIDWLASPGGIHIVTAEQVQPDDLAFIESAASVFLDATGGTLADQLTRLEETPAGLPAFVPVPSSPLAPEPTVPLDREEALEFDCGLGGFASGGEEYVIRLDPGQTTPAPWAHVLANPEFGCLVTEGGGGYTWATNSSENRLTAWRNDPVLDEVSEAVYLRDEETGQVWSATQRPAGPDVPREVRYGAGYATFRQNSHGLEQRMRIFCALEDSAKIVELTLTNQWRRPRRFTITYFAELVLGSSRANSSRHLLPEFDGSTQTLLVRNPYSLAWSERYAFLTSSEPAHGVTTDRKEFLGAEGDFAKPGSLFRIGLSGRIQPDGDVCAAYQVHIDLPAGASRSLHFVLGQAETRSAAIQLARRFSRPSMIRSTRNGIKRYWDRLLGSVTVSTPEPAMDIMLNRWLPYQVINSRLWGRTGYYQSSGAFGFRDQLQDVLSLLDLAPSHAREHILAAARHQFSQGDVLHWWHPETEVGVRTRCSDDLVWLPYATATYVQRTGDAAILDELAGFIEAEPLRDSEGDRYGRYVASSSPETLYEHCLRALRKADTHGSHGLPLIGSGDWNDGLDRVGAAGDGESVWLGWFLAATLREFATMCDLQGDSEQSAVFQDRAAELIDRIEETSWDGDWYRRAYYGDGTPLGSSSSREGKIDLISQAWAVLAGGAETERQNRAMESVAQLLFRPEKSLVLLLHPPFDRTSRDPGYIKAYPPGVRENGGQYTHAAVWAGWAFGLLGQSSRAVGVFRMLNPVLRVTSEAAAREYRVEPYVVPGDVYGAPPYVGRGGWTWYTGAAGWFYRFGVEQILGLQRQGQTLSVNPRIPDDWPGYEIRMHTPALTAEIRVFRSEGGQLEWTLDGRKQGAVATV